MTGYECKEALRSGKILCGTLIVDDILSVEGLDGIVIGPNDLSYSLGDPNNYDSPLFEETVIGILKKARGRGIAPGIHYMGGIGRQIQWAKETGMNLLFHSGDLYIFADSLCRDLVDFRQEPGLFHEDKAGLTLQSEGSVV